MMWAIWGFPCHPFRKMKDGMWKFSQGCLGMDRWDELNQLFNKTGVIVTFGLNALYGRHKIGKGVYGDVYGGAWNSSNTRSFINYTISKGYRVDSWELGNELSNGFGASVDGGAEQYGKDLITLKAILRDLYKGSHQQPLLLAPGGFYDQKWYNKLLQVSGTNVADVLTHHIYNLGAGDDPHVKSKILDPHYLSQISEIYKELQLTIQRHGPWATAWVGESGGAYNSGGRLVANHFVYSFCDEDWEDPTIDRVPGIKARSFCVADAGITLLLINLSNTTEFHVTIQNGVNINLHKGEANHRERSSMDILKKFVTWIKKASDGSAKRQEYHLTPKDGNLLSRTMVLNGNPLVLTENGNIPALDPVLVDANLPTSLAPYSIAFVTIPNFKAPACT
ncbi:Glycoside hydrolase [Cinnamomum micranthum f. kanehirae]|uniref:Glycoside hydrolase n=1 Tax=Cinnamomum micranthum f. kanehirae TaxID=337451 RepID=A0A443N381_9MAGN|nr:Glycoside hydrolase [Cinnamomum micranthum f. kanehirae]